MFEEPSLSHKTLKSLPIEQAAKIISHLQYIHLTVHFYNRYTKYSGYFKQQQKRQRDFNTYFVK